MDTEKQSKFVWWMYQAGDSCCFSSPLLRCIGHFWPDIFKVSLLHALLLRITHLNRLQMLFLWLHISYTSRSKAYFPVIVPVAYVKIGQSTLFASPCTRNYPSEHDDYTVSLTYEIVNILRRLVEAEGFLEHANIPTFSFLQWVLKEAPEM